MPAQWPTFVNNVSGKLSARSADTRNDFAVFLANEYFNAVKGSQTTFGDQHISGQKPILEAGFKEAFEKIYSEERVPFDDKFEMARYADFFEPLPNNDFDYDPLCEIEEWTRNNQETLSKFTFYQLFPSTCPPYKEIDIYAGIDFNMMVEQGNLDAENAVENTPDGILYATLSIINFTQGVGYKFVYDINGVEQPALRADEEGILQLRVNADPGTYTYTFKKVLDLDSNIIKEINKSATVEINDNGEVENITIIPDPSEGKTPRQLIPELTEDQIVEILAYRVLYQNDGTEDFKKWVLRLNIGYNLKLGEKVSKKVMELVEDYYKTEEAKIVNTYTNNYENLVRKTLPTIEQLGIENTLNEYIFQSEHIDVPDSIPEWLTPNDYICKFTYVKQIDSNSTVNLSNLDSFEERLRIQSKEKLYQAEKREWWQRLRDWANSQTGDPENVNENGDGYDIMAKAIIDYWKSTAQAPFKPTPPVPPCNIPAPQGGIYAPISYGSEATLANDLRRAWNTGKRFGKMPLTPVASKAVASAVSVACAKHLLTLKFLYLGGISTPGGPVPMVGFVPLVI